MTGATVKEHVPSAPTALPDGVSLCDPSLLPQLETLWQAGEKVPSWGRVHSDLKAFRDNQERYNILLKIAFKTQPLEDASQIL